MGKGEGGEGDDCRGMMSSKVLHILQPFLCQASGKRMGCLKNKKKLYFGKRIGVIRRSSLSFS